MDKDACRQTFHNRAKLIVVVIVFLTFLNNLHDWFVRLDRPVVGQLGERQWNVCGYNKWISLGADLPSQLLPYVKVWAEVGQEEVKLLYV